MAQYKLPSGEYTTSVKCYILEWRKLVKAVEQVLDVKVYAFDPGLAVCDHDDRGSWSLPLHIAKRIAALKPATGDE